MSFVTYLDIHALDHFCGSSNGPYCTKLESGFRNSYYDFGDDGKSTLVDEEVEIVVMYKTKELTALKGCKSN